MFKLTIKAVFFAILLLVVAGWLLLFSPFFEERRIVLVEEILSEQTGQRVEITETVKLQLFPNISINSGRMVIVGGISEEMPLVELPSASFDLDLKSFLLGQLEITSVQAEGLSINLVTLEDGQTSWHEQSGAKDRDLVLDHKLVEYLMATEVQFSDFFLNISNSVSGFEFRGVVAEFKVTQGSDGIAAADGAGTLNGVPFEILADYQGKFGGMLLTFGEVTVGIEGELLPESELGYEALLKLEADSLDDFFDLLQLDSQMHGVGAFSAKVRRSSGEFRLSDITSRIELKTGGWLSIEGGINDLRSMSGIDLKLRSHLEEAKFTDPLSFGWTQMNLASFSTDISGDARHIQLSNVAFDLNSKDRGIESFGPFSVGAIKRRGDNTLSLEDLHWAVKTEQGADFAFRGAVRDLLVLEDFRIEGRGRVSLAELAENLTGFEIPDLGLAELDLLVTDAYADGVPTLERLSLQTSPDEALELRLVVNAADLLGADGVDYVFNVVVDDLAELQSTFDLKGDLAGPFEFEGRGQHSDGNLTLQTELVLGASDATVDLRAQVEGSNPQVVGSLASKVLNVQQMLGYVESLTKAFAVKRPRMEKTVQPLELDANENVLEIPGQPKVQPLVLKDEGLNNNTRLRRILEITHMTLTTSVERVVGLPGVRIIQSDVTLRDGLLRVAPVKLHLKGQSVQFDAEIDLLKTPELVRLTGNIFGWTLSDLTTLLNWDVAAEGTLDTHFDMVGRVSSIDDFLTSANGRLVLRLKNGSLGTSILKFASHGVFRWLFSQELSQGGSRVVCLVAPLRFSNGTVTLSDVTLETENTQVVVDGSIDMRADLLNVTGQPRPLGMPFEPSPYPFRVSGNLEDPEFTLLPAIKRVGNKRLTIFKRQRCRPDRTQVKGR